MQTSRLRNVSNGSVIGHPSSEIEFAAMARVVVRRLVYAFDILKHGNVGLGGIKHVQASVERGRTGDTLTRILDSPR